MIGSSPGLNWIPLGQLLVDGRIIQPEQLEQALVVKQTTGKRLGEVVVELGFTTERAIAGALAEQYGLEYVDLASVELDRNAVSLLTEALARRYEALPIRMCSDGLPLLAVTDPTNVATADDLRFALGANFRLAVAERAQIDLAISRAYRRSLELITEETEVGAQPVDQRVHDVRDMASSEPTINLVNSLLTTGVQENASDIHFEPRRDDMAVRVRIDGVMRDLTTIPKHMVAAVASRLKIMGQLDPSDRRSPQAGRASASFGGDPIGLRITTLPTTEGEQIVLGIVGRGHTQQHTLASLELEPRPAHVLRSAIEQPSGIVIVCGPTGSGRTTTLYAALDHVKADERVVMTIEDPVEHRLDGINQIEVDLDGGLTFATGLRTILRSDPDVVLVGELDDAETASLAIRAALTGRLVLTSLHAQDAASAIARLRDLQVHPALIASSVSCVVAQRLARRLCVDCRKPYTTSPEELGLATPSTGERELVLYAATGCPSCRGTGYTGRVALREVLPVEGEVGTLVERSAQEIEAAAVRHGMRTLREDGMRIALSGISSLEEIRRVTGSRPV
ncbi:MAG: type pilus assembly protein PilB [Gaiellaceae bacterium]|nr:type pilus assembly protein PilB [Gaiellaceae bacterium]